MGHRSISRGNLNGNGKRLARFLNRENWLNFNLASVTTDPKRFFSVFNQRMTDILIVYIAALSLEDGALTAAVAQQAGSDPASLTYLSFYPRDAMLARVFAIATCPSVCLSVRPSVRRAPVLCLAERKQDREMYTI